MSSNTERYSEGEIMKILKKFIYFIETLDEFSFKSWEVRNNKSNELLGKINFYKDWKQYVFYPSSYTYWSKDCIKDLYEFMNTHGV